MKPLGLWPALALTLLGAGMSGCTVTSEPAPTAVIIGTQPTSTLIVDWTIELRKDPVDCYGTGGESLRVRVVTVSGLDAGTYEQACTAFSTSIVLAPGTYSATAQLLDFAGRPRTTSVSIPIFTLFGNDFVTVPIDFPADSFF